jgi:hypothetical protein
MKSEIKLFTYQTRLNLTDEQEAILNDYAELMGRVERTLFAKMTANNNLNELKVLFLKKFQITARQFNSCRVHVEGKIESIKKLRIYQIEESKDRISELEKKLEKIKINASPQVLHQKKTPFIEIGISFRNLSVKFRHTNRQYNCLIDVFRHSIC